YNNLARCLEDLGKADEALPLHRKALAIRQKALGDGHPHTAISCNNVAACLEDLGKADEAVPLYKNSLATFENALGEGHPDTATGYNNLARCLWDLGEHARAVRLWQRSLEAQETARFHLQRESGFERAFANADKFPARAGLAVGLASLGQPRNA